jgi:hypothetical protein
LADVGRKTFSNEVKQLKQGKKPDRSFPFPWGGSKRPIFFISAEKREHDCKIHTYFREDLDKNGI